MTHYGSYSTNTGAGVENRYRYNGMELQEDLGIYTAAYRSYDPAIGRWLQVDPKSESFVPMSPYAGMGNNSISIVDPLGDSIIVLSAPQQVMGLGHAAVLIGNEADGWTLYSDYGTYASKGASGPSDKHPEDGVDVGTLEEFANSEHNKTEYGGQLYQSGYMLEADGETDEKMAAAASREVQEDYNVLSNSCIDVCTGALEAGGFNGGYENVGRKTPARILSTIPNERFQATVRGNQGGTLLLPKDLKPK